MERFEITEQLTDMWDACQQRNVGSNEAELDFIESVADWHIGVLNELDGGLLIGAKKVLVVSAMGRACGGIKKMALGLQKAKAEVEMLDIGDTLLNNELLKSKTLTLQQSRELSDLKVTNVVDDLKPSPVYTPKRKKFKRK